MAIHRRLTAEFDLIYAHDEALIDLPTNMVTQWYTGGRNIEDLDLTKCQVQPTIFKCRPLQTKYEYLKDEVLNGASSACWQIFRHHVKSAKNFLDENGKPILEWEDEHDPAVKNECRNEVPHDVVADIASVIIGKAEESSAVFTLPRSFLEVRARSLMLRARDVAERIVNEKKSE
jgi:hypothetical protein